MVVEEGCPKKKHHYSSSMISDAFLSLTVFSLSFKLSLLLLALLMAGLAYVSVQCLAVLSNAFRSERYCAAISLTNGSRGLGSQSKEELQSQ
jgi:hypothetical protein